MADNDFVRKWQTDRLRVCLKIPCDREIVAYPPLNAEKDGQFVYAWFTRSQLEQALAYTEGLKQ